MNENKANTCITCGKPLDRQLDAEGWYPTAPWVPKRLGGAGRPAGADTADGKLVEVLDEMGVDVPATVGAQEERKSNDRHRL
ncbi:hypothetical protein [Mycobacteroides abscessus]|uniref:hypothetical protein n=1 Tax=Mycobacteroides abscessus TaxID=36809 RepID=UPI0009CEE6F6|nr:hypothetical protein [Mycobacteroides abscessus]SKP39074.1 Uncharacterised protein [Mycobacteroides abscessus subsp. abscessus]SLL09390.1 Uncharacterised protein [Mycobacteroides abscessus subsp. abscessus]